LRFLCIGILVTAAWAGTSINPDAAVTQKFVKSVSEYQSLRKDLESKLPRLKATGSPYTIAEHQQALAQAIRAARADFKQGDIFTPAVCAEFKRLASLAKQGGNAWRIEKSLADAEPVKFRVKVNEIYPPGVPQQSMPPSLLLNLPPLPQDIQYRLLGSTLLLIDTRANLVVDMAPDVIP
jgi:hypothetical protein